MKDLPDAVFMAIKYADENMIELPLDLRIRAYMAGAIKAAGDLAAINAKYHDAITQSLINYFENARGKKNQKAFKNAMIDAFTSAFGLGWADGGQPLPFSAEAVEWLSAKVAEEVVHIDGLFVNAKELRKEKDFDYFAWITERADGYTQTLQAIYNAGRMFALKNKMLAWSLGATEKHCKTCAKLDGQRHRAAWYVSRNYIPRMPGASMECGGYKCDCHLSDDEGNEITI